MSDPSIVNVDGDVQADAIVLEPAPAALTSAVINVSASGDNTLITGTIGQTIRVYRVLLVMKGGADLIFKDGAATNLTGAMTLTSAGSIVLDFNGEPWFVTSSGNAFILNLSAAKQASGRIYYIKS